jgi:NADH:ubiquinone oxidoreductase subunit 4 (subunit M)
MSDLTFALLIGCAATPLAGAAILTRVKHAPLARVIASAATGVSVLCAAAQFLGSSGRHVRSLLIADGLNAVPMALFAILAFLSIVLSPRQDAAPRSLAGMLVTTSGTLAAYAADNLILFFVAWVVSMLPFLLSSADRAAPHGTRTPAQDSAGPGSCWWVARSPCWPQ